MLKLLPTRDPGCSALQLCHLLKDAGFEVSKRTVERDLQELSCIFPLMSDESASPYLWRWMDNASVDIPGVSIAEAISLHMVEGTIKTVLPKQLLHSLEPKFQQAKSKIAALSPSNPSASLIDKIAVVSPTLPMLQPQSIPEVVDSIQQALVYDKQLQVSYFALHDNTEKNYLLNPLGLVQRGHITYLVATISPYKDIRLFALHRFKTATVLDTESQKPDGFSLSEYLVTGALQFSNGNSIKLEAKINAYMAALLTESPLSEDMLIEPSADHGFRLKATVPGGWQLEWWLLSHCTSVEVTSPAELRERIKQKLRAGADLYTE
jgi:predicted DNA-binding transcriptional regulator YafY